MDTAMGAYVSAELRQLLLAGATRWQKNILVDSVMVVSLQV